MLSTKAKLAIFYMKHRKWLVPAGIVLLAVIGYLVVTKVL